MSLARWEPFTEMRRMREEMDRALESFWRPMTVSPIAWEPVAPLVDVYEKDKNIMVKAEVPGVSKDELDITATEDSITLKGEFKREEDYDKEGYHRCERRYGSFYRVIPMPAAIKPDKVKATFKDGVLEVTAPKAVLPKPKEKRIAIQG